MSLPSLDDLEQAIIAAHEAGNKSPRDVAAHVIGTLQIAEEIARMNLPDPYSANPYLED